MCIIQVTQPVSARAKADASYDLCEGFSEMADYALPQFFGIEKTRITHCKRAMALLMYRSLSWTNRDADRSLTFGSSAGIVFKNCANREILRLSDAPPICFERRWRGMVDT